MCVAAELARARVGAAVAVAARGARDLPAGHVPTPSGGPARDVHAAALGVAGDGRGSTKHVVDDARVAGGIAVTYPGRADAWPVINADSYGFP